MSCSHCFHSGPVHASFLEPRLAPRIWCDDCQECRHDAESRDLPLRSVRMSHIALLRVLVEATAGGRGSAAAAFHRTEVGAAFERHGSLWTAPEDHIDTVIRDLAEWALVERSAGVARPVHAGSPTHVYDGGWSARATDSGRDLHEAMRRLGR